MPPPQEARRHQAVREPDPPLPPGLPRDALLLRLCGGGMTREAAALGSFVHVFVERATMAAVPIPDGLRKALAKLQR